MAGRHKEGESGMADQFSRGKPNDLPGLPSGEMAEDENLAARMRTCSLVGR